MNSSRDLLLEENETSLDVLHRGQSCYSDRCMFTTVFSWNAQNDKLLKLHMYIIQRYHGVNNLSNRIIFELYSNYSNYSDRTVFVV